MTLKDKMLIVHGYCNDPVITTQAKILLEMLATVDEVMYNRVNKILDVILQEIDYDRLSKHHS